MSFVNTYSQEKEVVRENYIGIGGGVTTFAIVMDSEFIINNEQLDLSTSNNGRTAGIAYKNFSEKSVGLALEFNYIKKGGNNVFIYNSDENPTDTTVVLFKHDLEYVELPFMMNLRFGKKKLKINLYGGPNISYLFNQKITILGDKKEELYKTGTDLKFEFALNGGGGISYKFGKNVFELGMRFSQGLTNIFKYKSINSALRNQNQVTSARFNYYYIF